jgi:hypothetical protein
MKYELVILAFSGFLALTSVQNDSANRPQVVSPSVGLKIGDKAPIFRARDQFDHDESKETLRGSNGTILLFFRSADW